MSRSYWERSELVVLVRRLGCDVAFVGIDTAFVVSVVGGAFVRAALPNLASVSPLQSMTPPQIPNTLLLRLCDSRNAHRTLVVLHEAIT